MERPSQAPELLFLDEIIKCLFVFETQLIFTVFLPRVR